MRIGIVAGEVSGDALGAGLVSAIRERAPETEFIGICGPKMLQLGVRSLYPMDRISIIGLDGLVSSLFQILAIRRALKSEYFRDKPDVFVGIDVPDFNLGLEARLKASGVPTVHYVSPTVWAWRGYRIHKIRRAVSHMLTLFPFEADYYRRFDVPVTYVGHPIADQVAVEIDPAVERNRLGIAPCGPLIALLPGSRGSEVRRLGPLFIDTANRLVALRPDAQFVVPFANAATRQLFESYVNSAGGARLHLIDGSSRQAIAAADLALLASGTAALEAALLRTPMVVAYKVSPFTYGLVRLFGRVTHYSMPNNLLDEPLVPEFIQGNATADNLLWALLDYLDNSDKTRVCVEKFRGIHNELRRDANRRAADAILTLIGRV